MIDSAKKDEELKSPIARVDERPRHAEQHIDTERREDRSHVDDASPYHRPADRDRRQEDECGVEYRRRTFTGTAQRDD